MKSFVIIILLFYLLSCSDALKITDHNIAYLAALFPESDIIRRQLQDNRLKTLIPPIMVGSSETEDVHQSYSLLLDITTIATSKLQVLFLHLLVK